MKVLKITGSTIQRTGEDGTFNGVVLLKQDFQGSMIKASFIGQSGNKGTATIRLYDKNGLVVAGANIGFLELVNHVLTDNIKLEIAATAEEAGDQLASDDDKNIHFKLDAAQFATGTLTLSVEGGPISSATWKVDNSYEININGDGFEEVIIPFEIIDVI